MNTAKKTAWGKSCRTSGATHHLIHHSADVAAVLKLLLEHPLLHKRVVAAYGQQLSKEEIAYFSALACLHDIGKLAPGFQARSWPKPLPKGLAERGHLECGWLWMQIPFRPDALAGAMKYLARWQEISDWFPILFAHHGRPIPKPGSGVTAATFARLPDYDWEAEETLMGRALLAWFPEIATSAPPPLRPAFAHLFCGLLNLADWIGSDRDAFPFEAEFRLDYWETAKKRAADRLSEIGFAADSLRLRGPAGWALISDHSEPRPAQKAVGALPVGARLILLEAETGSGKTEAALWRFLVLLEAGEVDALYFAAPTRAAVRQLHDRINKALLRMFDPAPEAVLAIPGQIVAGEASGIRLPDFSVLWDDEDAAKKPARWAAEHSARYLAARIAVGTVDQAALGGLQVKYAHLRGAAMSRALLVIDEVHASDAYMTEIQTTLVRSHLDLGGHAMLMSATLGAAARRKWRREAPNDLATDAALPYPALWTEGGVQPILPEENSAKEVHVSAQAGWSGEQAAALALEAARKGARVLVIRNTVARAQETFAACLAAAPELLFSVRGVPTLHHSRFAAEDRALLDEAVETAIGKDSPLGGRIVIGTQTLEQSLDLCADLLITDLCPMDVLLQRIGRLHRHKKRPRPKGFEEARAIVLTPEGGLAPLTQAAENGLGAYPGGPSLSGVYIDVPGLAATLAEIEARPLWRIPEMNRALVEAATHPEALDRVAAAHGWKAYRQSVMGKAFAATKGAGLVLLDRKAPLPPSFPEDEKIQTRLGEQGAILTLPEGAMGAFGAPISRLALPARWSQGLTGEEEVRMEIAAPSKILVGEKVFLYGAEGLRQGD